MPMSNDSTKMPGSIPSLTATIKVTGNIATIMRTITKTIVGIQVSSISNRILSRGTVGRPITIINMVTITRQIGSNATATRKMITIHMTIKAVIKPTSSSADRQNRSRGSFTGESTRNIKSKNINKTKCTKNK